MKKFVRHLSIATAVFVLAAFCVSAVSAAGSDEKAKEILEKTFKKYIDLLKKSDNKIKSIAAKISMKGGGDVPMGNAGTMPMKVNATLEFYFSQPRNLYVALSGNLGNAKIIVTGKEKKVATIMLPDSNQFARMDVPEEAIEDIDRTAEEEPDIEEFFKEVNLSYDGTAETKLGKAHKITIQPKDSSEEGSATIYIRDGEWDPVRLDFSAGDKGNVVIEFEKLELNKKISDKQFVPDTEGYTEIDQDQLFMVVMMQVMGAMRQGGAE